MSTELDAVKRKIMSLAAKTVANGCSEHEAISAMQGVGRLLLQYNLTMEECDVRASKCKTIYLDVGRLKRHPIDGCVCALAALVDAKVWFHRTWSDRRWKGKYHKLGTSYAFFGQEQDLELLEYLFKVIHTAIETETETFKQKDGYRNMAVAVAAEAGPELQREFRQRGANSRRSASVSFQHGMAMRIAARLHELKKQNDEYLARTRNSRALVVLKNQLVEDEFLRHGPKRLGRVRLSRAIRDMDAYKDGHAAAEKVNLQRPLGTYGDPKGYLK